MSKSISTLNLGSGAGRSIRLYHGSPDKELIPTFGLGDDKHDYGRGFYLTPDVELAKEWSAGNSWREECWVHSYTLSLDGLSVLDFEQITKHRALEWITEILRHREPDRDQAPFYEIYRDFLFSLFNRDTNNYDVVCGWRADDSYFRVVNQLLGDALSLSLLEEALRLGDLGIQYCCRSEKAFANLKVAGPPERVPYAQYSKAYHRRDSAARDAFTELQRSPRNRPRKGNLYMRDLYVAKGGC